MAFAKSTKVGMAAVFLRFIKYFLEMEGYVECMPVGRIRRPSKIIKLLWNRKRNESSKFLIR